MLSVHALGVCSQCMLSACSQCMLSVHALSACSQCMQLVLPLSVHAALQSCSKAHAHATCARAAASCVHLQLPECASAHTGAGQQQRSQDMPLQGLQAPVHPSTHSQAALLERNQQVSPFKQRCLKGLACAQVSDLSAAFHSRPSSAA